MADIAPQYIVGVKRLVEFLNARGCPIKYSVASKLCAPKIGKGPPVVGYWGSLPAFDSAAAIPWWRDLFTPTPGLLVPPSSKPQTDQSRRGRGRPRKARTSGEEAV